MDEVVGQSVRGLGRAGVDDEVLRRERGEPPGGGGALAVDQSGLGHHERLDAGVLVPMAGTTTQSTARPPTG